MRRRLTAALLVSLALASPARSQGQPVEETPESLPDFPGREEAFGSCIGCHSFKVVGRQGMSRERWDGTIDWMSERHGMPRLDPELRKTVLEYLVKAYPEPQGRSGGWVSPFAPK